MISVVVVFCFSAFNLLVDEGHLLLNMTGTVVGYIIILYFSRRGESVVPVRVVKFTPKAHCLELV